MSLKPLTPLTPQRAEWESLTCHELELLLGCTTSDAQSIMEVQHETVDAAYMQGMNPAEASASIDIASTVS